MKLPCRMREQTPAEEAYAQSVCAVKRRAGVLEALKIDILNAIMQ